MGELKDAFIRAGCIHTDDNGGASGVKGNKGGEEGKKNNDSGGEQKEDEKEDSTLDDLFVPTIKELSNFMKHENDGAEQLCLVALKMCPGFNGLLSLLKNDCVEEWTRRGRIYNAVLDMLGMFAENDMYVTTLRCVS